MWKMNCLTGLLLASGTVVGEGVCLVPVGEYRLGPVTDFDYGIPLLGTDGTHRITADTAATDGIVLPVDVVDRIIASRASALVVTDADPVEAE